jgi:TrbL/VirB6 plasmid conjugal transfer protein
MNIERLVMNRHHIILLLVAVILSLAVNVGGASAANVPSNLLDNCTNSSGFFDYDNNPVNQSQDMLQTVVDDISTSVTNASNFIFTAFTTDSGYQDAITAAFYLVAIFFAVSFMFGFETITLAQVVIRLVKIGLIIWLVSTTGLLFLQDYFVRFFNQGGAWLINAMINIATTGAVGVPSTVVSAPFAILDEIIRVVFSPRMFVTIIATLSTGPFGFIVAGALIWSVFSIFMGVLKALQVYAISIVMKAILLGMAPVFFPMILFGRTKSMFTGWINQLVNFTLQPIIMFAFLAFFATLVASAARDILPPDDVHVCYVKADNQASTPFDSRNWKFMCCTGGTCTPYEGKWAFNGAINCPGAPTFPMNHINILVFLLLTHIMVQLVSVATSIAAEISQGSMDLGKMANPLSEWFGGSSKTATRSVTQVAKK